MSDLFGFYLQLDDWVLCRIYKKTNSQRCLELYKDESSMDEMLISDEPNFFGGMLSHHSHLQTLIFPQLGQVPKQPMLSMILPSLDNELWTGTNDNEFKKMNGGDQGNGCENGSGSGNVNGGSFMSLLSSHGGGGGYHQNLILGSMSGGGVDGYSRPGYHSLNWNNS